MKKLIAVAFLACFIMGCNVNATTLKGTGLLWQTGPLTIVAGAFDTSITSGEFAEEQIIITHETYYDTDLDASTGVTQGQKSKYEVRITPVAPQEKPDASVVTPDVPK